MTSFKVSNPQTDERLAAPIDPGSEFFKRAIIGSVALHVALVAVFTVRAVFFPSEPLQLEQVIRVDMVALPDKATAKLPPMEEPAPQPQAEAKPEPPKPEPPKPEPAKPELPKPPVAQAPPAPPKPEAPAVNLNKTKQDQEAALKRLQALQRLEKLQQKESPPPSTGSSSERPTQTVQAQPVKGNEISTGASLRGIVRLEHQNYMQTVDGHVKRYWNLPGWMANSKLRAKVRLYVDGRGNVVKKELTQPSSNPVYDERVMRAIESASPLPRPPENLVSLLSVDGMELEFVPD